MNSDCEETETEITFYDDDDEWSRARSEGEGFASGEDYSDEDDSEAGSDTMSADGEAAGSTQQWSVLEKPEMVDFVMDDANMAAMRANGWNLGS